MRKIVKFAMYALFTVVVTVCLFGFNAFAAETEGIFTYTVSGDKATVTSIDWEGQNEIIIPETLGGYEVVGLADYMMQDNSFNFGDNSVSAVYLPKTVTNISTGAFSLADVEKIFVDEENPNYSSDEYGVVFNKDKTTLVVAPCSMANAEYTVPDTVEKIGRHAFGETLFVEHITLPDSVSTIEEQAFFQALSLKRIDIPEGITIINQNAFARCASLVEVTLPSTLKTIKNSSFTECGELKEIRIPEGVETIGFGAFDSDSALERVFLPSTLTTVDRYAFGSCSALAHVYYSGTSEQWDSINISDSNNEGIKSASIHCDFNISLYNDIIFDITDGIFTLDGEGATPYGGDDSWHLWDEDKEDVTTLIIEGDVDTISAYSFTGFEKLSAVIIRTENISIEPNAFSDCPLLETIILFGNSDYQQTAFNNCASEMRVFENSKTTHTHTLFSTSVAVSKFTYGDDGTLRFSDAVKLDAYEFLDTAAAFCIEYDNIESFEFESLTFEDIPIYYKPVDSDEYIEPENNTVTGVKIVPFVYIDYEDTQVTFNYLVNGISDGSIEEFMFIYTDNKGSDYIETNVNILEEFYEFMLMALKWIVSLLNKLFNLISKIK